MLRAQKFWLGLRHCYDNQLLFTVRGELVVRQAHHIRQPHPVRGELVEPCHPHSSGQTEYMLMSFWVYILQCADKSYYTGHTDNLEQRVAQHQQGYFATCYTYTRRPLELVFSQDFVTREEALTSEQQIKGWSRKKKEAMMQGDWAEVSRLAKSPTPVRGELVVRLAHHNRKTAPVRGELVEPCASTLRQAQGERDTDVGAV